MRKKAFLCLVFSALLIWGALLPALADEEVTLTILDTEEAQIPEAAETAEPARDPAARGQRVRRGRSRRPGGLYRRDYCHGPEGIRTGRRQGA